MFKKLYYQIYKIFLFFLGRQFNKYLNKRMKWPVFRNDIQQKKEVMLSMRDGVKLATDIYLPEITGKVPAILIRLPYDKKVMGSMYKIYSRYGYAVVLQDSRGCYASEGEFDHFKNETADGMDTLRWIEKRPWFNGKSGTMGPSYMAIPQFAIASEAPECLKCIIPQFMTTDFYSIAYWHGLFRVHIGIFYGLAVKDRSQLIFPTLSEVRKIGKYLPFKDIDKKFHKKDSLFEFAVQNPVKTSEWEKILNVYRLRENPVPALYIAGWNDLYCQQQIDDYNRHIAGTSDQNHSKLVIGPWTHIPFYSKKMVDFPDIFYEYQKIIIDWLDYHLQDKKSITWGPVRYYHIGINKWIDSQQLIDSDLEQHTLYLTKSAGNTHHLCTKSAAITEQLNYIYDPEKPLATSGGAYLTMQNFGVRVQKRYKRKDVLTFISDPFNNDFDIKGNIELELWVKTTVINTAFIGRLSIIKNGKAWFLNESAVTLSHRESDTKMSEYVPGSIIRITIKFPLIIQRIFVNEQIRLDISSSSYPAFNQYPNCAIEEWAFCEKPIIANQTVFTGSQYKSKLIIPGRLYE